MQMYVWEPLVRGLQANSGWKEVKEVKEGKWKEHIWKKHEQNQKNITGNCMEIHTHRQTESEKNNERNESKTEVKKQCK